MSARRSSRLESGGFTLVELLVSLVVTLVLLVILVETFDYTRKIWADTSGKSGQFRGAQEGFEAMTRRLSQATLNTYWDYHYPNNDTTQAPDRYIRQSELRFLSGSAPALVGPTYPPGSTTQAVTHAVFFQAPLGFVDSTDKTSPAPPPNLAVLSNLLNTWGYFVEFADDRSSYPAFLSSMGVPLHYRFRLMEIMEPSNKLDIYHYTSGLNGTSLNNATYHKLDWFTDSLKLTPRPVHVLAENVIALILLPKLSPSDETALMNTAGSGVDKPLGTNLSPTYLYDSTATGAINAADPSRAANATVPAALNWKNQLPPVIQVTMVTVDEPSYSRFQADSTTMPTALLPLPPNDLFQNVGDTMDPKNPGFAQDLQTLEGKLQANHIVYRVFTTNVSLKAAKWSRSQKN